MTALASLPTLSVQIAFNPTNLQTLTQTWTDVTQWVRDFSTSSGRQHFLDRIESSTIRMTLDNRTGYFLNGTTNGTGAVIRTRLPIRVVAGTPQINVTAISGSGTVVTYTAANTYTTGQQVVVQGATTAGFNGVFTIATASSTQFTVASTVTGSSSTATAGLAYPIFWGLTESAEERTADQLNQDIILTATDNTKYLSLLYMNRPTFWANYAKSANALSWYRCDGTQALPDLIGGNTGNVVGTVQNVSGTLLYDTDTAIDLTNGQSNGTNVAYLNIPTGATAVYSIDFWVIGQNLAGQYLIDQVGAASNLAVTPSGALQGINTFSGASNPYFQNNAANVSDGQWHHVGLVGYKSGSTYPLYLYLDGTYVNMGDNGGPLIPANGKLRIGNLNGLNAVSPSYAYVDEIVISKDSGSLAPIQGEINNRFKAGSLLSDSIASGDRIAEVLTLAGFGTITAGALVVPNFYVNDVAWSTNSGAFFVQGFQSAVTDSTALDLIQQVTDTDVGAFFQRPDGSFEFDDQAYLYTPTNNATPSGDYVWTDISIPRVTTTTTFYEPSTLQVLHDDADVWTTVKITAQNGTVQTYENTTNEPLYGYSTLTKSNVVSVTNEQANQEAIYLGNLYQSPLPRIGNVELRSETNNGANLVQMLKPYLNDQVQFQRTPNGASVAGSINSTVVIESIRHDFQADPGYWHSSFTLDPYPKRGQNSTPQTFFMLFDDATYGKFDSTNDYL